MPIYDTAYLKSLDIAPNFGTASITHCTV